MFTFDERNTMVRIILSMDIQGQITREKQTRKLNLPDANLEHCGSNRQNIINTERISKSQRGARYYKI